MKLISPILIALLLSVCTACSKEEKQPDTSVQKATAEIIKTEAASVAQAQKAMEDAKQVNQIIQDSAEQQRETIEKTQR
jgi:hypothetical protein